MKKNNATKKTKLKNKQQVNSNRARLPVLRQQQILIALARSDLTALSNLGLTPEEINSPTSDNSFHLPLMHAVLKSSPTLVNWCLNNGANPNTLFDDNGPVLHSKISFRAGLYYSPLGMAITDLNVEIVALLLEAGADLNLPYYVGSPFGYLPCHQSPYYAEIESQVNAERERIKLDQALYAIPSLPPTGPVRL
jgi:ankyrin repeat protein